MTVSQISTSTFYEETRERTSGPHRLVVTSVPAQHGPALAHRLLPPTMGMVVELFEHDRLLLRLYQSGDTLCRSRLGEIRQRLGQPDVLVVHLGGTRVAGLLVTMDGKQGADLVELVDPQSVIPVHYDDYTVFGSPLSEFTQHAAQRGYADKVRTVARGDTCI